MITTDNKSKIKELIESSFFVIDKESKDTEFKLNKAQERFLEDMTGRDLILKARQLGFSTLVLAIFTYDFLFKKNSVSMSISYETGAAQKLLDKVKHFIEPLGVPLRYNSRNEMFNEAMGSSFYIGTAAAVTTGRGQTINNLHASEVAFYPDADTLMTGLLQSVPKDGNVIMESTANGMGNLFHREWKRGEEGEGAYTTHFFPWSADPEYTAFVEPGTSLKGDDRVLADKHGLTRGQVAWMNQKKKEFKTDDEFRQEYPLAPQEAFISSGNPAFDMHSLSEMMDRCKKPKRTGNLVGNKYHMDIEDTDRGFLAIYEEPRDMDEYVIGADVAQMVDFSSAHVIKKRTAEVVAVWHGRLDPKDFGKELERLGYYYNNATIAVERNNQGIATLAQLNESYYPMLFYRDDVTDTGENSTSKLGWETNIRTRPILISDLGTMIRTRDIHCWDEPTIDECMTFVRGKNGKEEAQSGCHDDRVISLAIAIQVYRRSPSSRSNNPMTTNHNPDLVSRNDFHEQGSAFDVY
jgi:hypothetical protein